MEYDIEKILYTFEDDYNPSSTVPGPRNMYAGGQLVSPSVDGSRPGYSGKTAKKAILNLPDEGEIDLDKLAKKHKVSTSLISQYRNRYKPNLTSVKKVKQPTMLTKEQQKIFRQYKKLHTGTQSDSSIRFKIKNNIINADTITKLQKGIPLTATDKDKTALDADTIKKIKQKIKLKPGQKWNFYNPETNPTGHTYGIKKSDNVNLYDKARTIGKPGRLETSIKKSKEKYEKIKADPKLLAAAQKDRKEKYLANREEILENQRLKYETDKQWRKAKLEWSRIDKIKNPEKYKKRMNEWLAKRGQFPPGNNYKESVWRDMFRSSQKEGQTRFLLVDENGNQLTQDKFPKVDGKVRWDRNANYKNVKFYDTVTKQFVKLDNSIKGKGITFEKYLDQKSVGGKGTYENAINGYRNKDTIKNITFTDSKGKNIRIGTVMSDKLKQGSNDFIKSGIVVQHPDIDNAFWKNEISTTSSNNKLNNLETILKRELRNAGDNTMLRNKALTKFKTEINNLPGGITKVMEGITYGNAPSTESVVAQVGKDFKIDRFKNFPKTRTSLRDAINDSVGELACGDKLAGGGRIKFSSGSSCNVRGRKILTDAVRNGISSIEPSKQNLVKKILTGSANLVKGVLDPKELFKLKNLIGFPAAVAAAVFDTAMVADDMIRKGEPFDEAAGNEMLAGMLNLQPQVQEAKRVLADPKSSLSPAAKKYAEMLVDIGEYNNTLQTKNIPMKVAGMPGDPEEQKMLQKKLDALDKKIFNTSTSGELDYLKEITERDAKDKAGSYVGEGGNEYGYTRTNALYDDPDKTDAPSFFSGQLKPSYGDLKQEPGKLPEYETKMIPAYVSQNYKTMDEQPLSKGMIDLLTKYERKKGTISADQNLDDVYFMNERFIEGPDGVSRKQKIKGLSPLEEYELQNKFGQVLSQPGMKGAQFSEGGITELRSKYEYKK